MVLLYLAESSTVEQHLVVYIYNCKMRAQQGKWLCSVLVTIHVNRSQVWCIYWYLRLEKKLLPLFRVWSLFQKEGITVDQCIFLNALCKFSTVSEKGWITVVLAYNIHWRKQGELKKHQTSASLYWNEVKGELFIHMAWQLH